MHQGPRLFRRWRPLFWLREFAAAACLLGGEAPLYADTVTATWNANPEPDIAGYRLSYGNTAGQYTTSIDAGNVTSRQVTLNPGARYYFVVQAYNTAGSVSLPSAEASVDLSAINQAPILTAPANQNHAENSSVSLQLAASDPDGQALTYSATGLPAALTVNASGLIGGTLSYTSAGTYSVTATASDGSLSASQTFQWTVANRLSGLTSSSDFDGDGRTDMTAYRPSTGEWFMLSSRSDYATGSVVTWGTSTDRPVPGTYDADVMSDIAIYRRSGIWSILPSSTGFATSIDVSLGRRADRPLPGDYDGDGFTDMAIFRPSTATWQIRLSSTNYATIDTLQFGVGTKWIGATADRPVPADYDGDGRTDIAVLKPSGLWSILPSHLNNTATFERAWGQSTDIPVPGDYDGDGTADIAVYRPSTGEWQVLLSNSNFTTSTVIVNGGPDEVPVPGDYDGDGKTDCAVFRTSTATWFVLKSSTRDTTAITVTSGLGTDVPLPVHP